MKRESSGRRPISTRGVGPGAITSRLAAGVTASASIPSRDRTLPDITMVVRRGTNPSSRRESAAAAIRRHSLVGHPQPGGRLAALVEDIDGHPAAGIPVTADPEPLRLEPVDQGPGDPHRAVLVEGTVVAIALQVQLQ